MNICGVSTSNLIQSLDSYHAARENGEKAYIIANGNELEVKTLTLWDRIYLFVQKLFGNTTPDTLYGQIKAGSDKIGEVVSELKFRNFDKFSLFAKKDIIVSLLKRNIINKLAERSFDDVNKALIVAIYLGIYSKPYDVKIDFIEGFFKLEQATDVNLFIKQKEKLKESLGQDNPQKLFQEMNEEYFGGHQVLKEMQILPPQSTPVQKVLLTNPI